MRKKNEVKKFSKIFTVCIQSFQNCKHAHIHIMSNHTIMSCNKSIHISKLAPLG